MGSITCATPAARKNQADESYTLMTTIQTELAYYKEQFEDKVVFCNCDDPSQSKFYEFFRLKFDAWGLKKLIATHYQDSSLFIPNTPSFKVEYDGNKAVETRIDGKGDFSSPECVEVLQEADIVCTNPPFSKIRGYLGQLIKHNKKFLIIGNMNAVTHKKTFDLIKNNRIWLGVTPKSGGIDFKIPDDYAVRGKRKGSNIKTIERAQMVNMSSAIWFTNLDNHQRNEIMPLFKRYDEEPEFFPKYDNYDAISVNKRREIPEDYEGEIGVPISFLQRYNPRQFEIVGADWQLPKTRLMDDNKKDRFYVNGKRLFFRLVVKHRNPKK